VTRRTVFFVSDQTGVTAETMGHSLLTQFDGQEFRPVTLPFISNIDKAQEAVRKIDATAADEGTRPIVFSTLVQEDVREVVKRAQAFGMRVTAWSRSLDDGGARRLGVERAGDLLALARGSDYLSLHLPLTAQTVVNAVKTHLAEVPA